MIGSHGRYPTYGLIVDEVQELAPQLIAHDVEGNPCSIFYDRLPIMNLTEIQRLHKVIEVQQALIDSIVLRLNDAGL